MHKFNLTLLISIFCFSLTLAQNKKNIKEQIDKIINFDEQINFSETPDILIGVIVKDSTFIFHYGNQTILTDSSIFDIGGITKIFTATLIHKMIEKGELSLKDKINLPSDHHFHPTIEALLSHQSGLPRIPDNLGQYERDMNNPYAKYSKKALFSFYKAFSPSESKLNASYSYSHVDYAILRHFIDNKFLNEYNYLLNEYVLHPMHLQDTYLSLPDEKKSFLVQGHSPFGQEIIKNDYNAFKGSLGIYSSMRDLLNFTQGNLGLKYPDFQSIFDTMQMPLIPTKISNHAYMGLGWHVIKKKKYYNAIAHVGVTKGHSSIIAFVKETQTGVIILSTSSKKYNNLAFLILRMLNFNWKKK